MAYYPITLSDDIATYYRVKAAERECKPTQVMAEVLTTHASGLPAESEDAAAEVFLAKLDPEHRQAILDCVTETHLSAAHYILNYILLARDQGLTSVTLPEAALPVPLPAALEASKTCEFCAQPFTPTREGQRYCPDKDDGTESCGRKAGLAALRAARTKTMDEHGLHVPHIFERRLVS